MTSVRIVAIDGPSASGKSSTAAEVASRLGLIHVDSGALYRALAWVSQLEGSDDPALILRAAERIGLTLGSQGGALVVRATGHDLEQALRTPAVSAGASRVAAHAVLRDWVNERLRAAVTAAGGAVVDGRDIGTVVFPQAQLKLFLTASPESRTWRRLLQQGGAVDPVQLASEAAALAERDERDATRAVAPLRPAADAVQLDGTALSLDEQVERIVAMARDRGLLGD